MSEFKGTVTGYRYGNSTLNVRGKKAISAVKSSKKSVASVAKDGKKAFEVTLKKAGTAKISFKYKGKKRTVTLKVKKYVNPVKTFKIGSTNLASKFKKTGTFTSTKYILGKLSVKAKPGWKIYGIEAYDGADTEEEEGSTTVKNGYKVTKSLFMMIVALQNKSTKGIIGLEYGSTAVTDMF